MAITAWSAKVCRERDLLFGKRPGDRACQNQNTDWSAFAEHRNADHGAISSARPDSGASYSGSALASADVNRSSLKQSATDAGSSSGLVDNLLERRLVFRATAQTLRRP